MTIVQIILIGLKLINAATRWARDQGLINQGRQLEIKNQLDRIAETAQIAREVDIETDAMTPEQINRDLEQDFRD